MSDVKHLFASSAGEHELQDKRGVLLYGDEIKPFQNCRRERWMYLGILAIPRDRWDLAHNMLTGDRLKSGYEGEMHFHNLTTQKKADLAKRWLDRVLWDDQKCFHFHVLGLFLDRLQAASFGTSGSQQRRRIYNRFFRTTVSYTLRSYFSELREVVVNSIFHDESEMRNDDLFDWHTIWRLGQQYAGVKFEPSRIEFIESDHHKEACYPEHSQFIQLIDLVLGATREYLDFTSRKKYLKEVAMHFSPLVERLTDEKKRSNPNSRYRHFRRCTIAFFPSESLTLSQLSDKLERQRSRFFCQRPSLLNEAVNGQIRLFG